MPRRASRGRASRTGIGDSVRVIDPLGFPYEFFHQTEHVERLSWRYDLHTPGELVRLDHFNQVTPDVPRAVGFMQSLGFRVTEDIQDEEGTVYAAWMRRKPTVHDTAMTGGDGPRMHHVAFATHEKHNILAICDKLGALRRSDAIERGPGRHGVSNAFYLYLRDPDGHRVEIYTQDYYTGDPDNPVITWDVHDNQRRDWWGNPVVPVLVHRGLASSSTSTATRSPWSPAPTQSEMAVTIGADGFSYTRPDDPADELPELEAGRVQAGPPAVAEDRMLHPDVIAQLADELAEADRTHRVIPRITARHPDATVEDSYAIQGVWRDKNLAAGRRLVGRKIGLTSKAMQQATGITEPDYGVMFDDTVYERRRYPGVAVLERADRGRAGLRAQGSRSKAPTAHWTTHCAAIDYAVPALEVLNSHIELEGRTIVDTIADNAAYGAMVLGATRKRPDEIDLRWVPGVALAQRRDRGDRRRRRTSSATPPPASPGSPTSSTSMARASRRVRSSLRGRSRAPCGSPAATSSGATTDRWE